MARKDETDDITLAEEKYSVKCPTLDELQEMLPFCDLMSKAAGIAGKVAAARDLIAAAIGKPSADLGKLHISPLELLDASEIIMRISGLEAIKNRKPAATA